MIPIYCTLMFHSLVLYILTVGVISSISYSSAMFMAAAQTTNVTQEPPGSQGSQGSQGPPGEQGESEPEQSGNILGLVTTTVEGDTVDIPGPRQFEVVESSATCSLDTILVGGGYRITEGVGLVLENLPQGNTWSVKAANPFPDFAGTSSGSLQAHALCISLNTGTNISSPREETKSPKN